MEDHAIDLGLAFQLWVAENPSPSKKQSPEQARYLSVSTFQELTHLSNGSGCDYGHDDKPKRAVERRAVPQKPKKGKGYESKKHVFIEIGNGESVDRSVVLVDHAARASRPRMGRWGVSLGGAQAKTVALSRQPKFRGG